MKCPNCGIGELTWLLTLMPFVERVECNECSTKYTKNSGKLFATLSILIGLVAAPAGVLAWAFFGGVQGLLLALVSYYYLLKVTALLFGKVIEKPNVW